MALLSYRRDRVDSGGWVGHCLFGAWLAACIPMLWLAPPASAQEVVMSGKEQELKVAFLYNFMLFTEWPPEVSGTLNLCIHGPDPFGDALEELQGRMVGTRRIALLRRNAGYPLKDCQVVFVAAQAIGGLPRLFDELRGLSVLTVADSPGASRLGVAINMSVAQNKITFEANLRSARSARLNLSSKLLRVATEVYQ